MNTPGRLYEQWTSQIKERSFSFPEFMPGLLADHQLRTRLALAGNDPRRLVIEPFAEGTKKKGVISYGLSSYGYDLRLGRNYLIFSDCAAVEVDPKNFNSSRFVKIEDADSCLIPPNSFLLAESMEYVEVPEDVSVVVLGKSTYARCGINLNMTPLEPGWRGIVTIEIANMTRLPARVYSNEGIGQMLFFQGSAPCAVPYSRKAGASYQDQKGLTTPVA